jgi:alpha-N-acetylglucosaminidase
LSTVYSGKSIETSRESPVCAKPALKVNGVSPNGGLNSEEDYRFLDLWSAPQELLRGSNQLHELATYQYDLVDIMRQCLSDLGLPIQKSIARAYTSGNKDSLKIATQQFLSLIDDMDELLATRKDFLLGKWIADARKAGNSPEEKDLYEKNARLLVTVWGPYDKNAMLYDYSSRQWSGLMKGFYKKRWEKYFVFLSEEINKGENKYIETKAINHRFNRPANEANDFYKALSKWEYQWCDNKENYDDKPVGDPYTVARKLFDKWQPVALKYYR